jgi:hypothetical protein
MTITAFEPNRLVTYNSTQPGLPDASHERHFEPRRRGIRVPTRRRVRATRRDRRLIRPVAVRAGNPARVPEHVCGAGARAPRRRAAARISTRSRRPCSMIPGEAPDWRSSEGSASPLAQRSWGRPSTRPATPSASAAAGSLRAMARRARGGCARQSRAGSRERSACVPARGQPGRRPPSAWRLQSRSRDARTDRAARRACKAARTGLARPRSGSARPLSRPSNDRPTGPARHGPSGPSARRARHSQTRRS